jgi:hypothetical protein
MPDLAQFQRRFAAAIQRPARPDQPTAMKVYRNTALDGAVKALEALYPVVRRVAGVRRFGAMAAGYASLYRPSSPVLAAYGARFPAYLAEQGCDAAPYLSDVARIDRMRAQAHIAADAKPFDPADPRQADWTTARPAMHPAARFLLLSTPALSVWARHADCSRPADAQPTDSVLVTRPWGEVIVSAIGPAHIHLLHDIGQGRPLAEAAARLADGFPRCDLPRVFATIVAAGALTAP